MSCILKFYQVRGLGRLGGLRIVVLFGCLGVVVCCGGCVLCVGRSRVLVCLLSCSLYVLGFLKVEHLFLFFGFFEPKFEEKNQTHLFGAGGGIRTHERLRDRVLSPTPLTWLGNPCMFSVESAGYP